MKTELINLYHLARTALSANDTCGKMDRINWAAEQYTRANPGVALVQAKIALYEALA